MSIQEGCTHTQLSWNFKIETRLFELYIEKCLGGKIINMKNEQNIPSEDKNNLVKMDRVKYNDQLGLPSW